MKKHNKILAIQGDPLNLINRKTDTTLLLALEAQKRKYKIYYYETKNITFKNNKITVEWSSSEGGANSLLQWTDNLGSAWQNILQDQYEIENSIIIYKERPRQEKRFYRLIKP